MKPKSHLATAILASTTLACASYAVADPAMSVITLNTQDPMGYMQWAKQSGPAIGAAIDATLGGVCLASAGYSAPGELYYWHVFEDHGAAMSASVYNEAVTKETAKLRTSRRIAGADLYSVAMASSGDLDVGDTFANYNLVISTDEPGIYMQQLPRLLAAAKSNGFEDITMNAYNTLTGPMTGDILVAVGAPNSDRLGQFIDAFNTPWMAPMLAGLAGIRSYENAFAMECTVVHSDD